MNVSEHQRGVPIVTSYSLKYEINNENEDQRENVQNVTTAQKYENKNLLKYCKPKKTQRKRKISNT